MQCNRCPINAFVELFATSNIDSAFGRCQNKKLIKAVDNFKSALQAVCVTCAKDADDDNPSNHGQIFVSLDSGSSHKKNSASPSPEFEGDIISRADWIAMHADPISKYQQTNDFIRNPHQNDSLSDPFFDPDNFQQDNAPLSNQPNHNDPLSQHPVVLPIRNELANFASLEIFDKLIVCCLFSGIKIAEIAKMKWLPKLVCDHKSNSIKPITSQAVYFRIKGIKKRFPNIAALADGIITEKKKKNKNKE